MPIWANVFRKGDKWHKIIQHENPSTNPWHCKFRLPSFVCSAPNKIAHKLSLWWKRRIFLSLGLLSAKQKQTKKACCAKRQGWNHVYRHGRAAHTLKQRYSVQLLLFPHRWQPNCLSSFASYRWLVPPVHASTYSDVKERPREREKEKTTKALFLMLKMIYLRIQEKQRLKIGSI